MEPHRVDLATAAAVDTRLAGGVRPEEDILILVRAAGVIGIMADTVGMEVGIGALGSVGRGMVTTITRTTPTIILTRPPTTNRQYSTVRHHQSCMILRKPHRARQIRRPTDQRQLYNQGHPYNR